MKVHDKKSTSTGGRDSGCRNVHGGVLGTCYPHSKECYSAAYPTPNGAPSRP